LRGRHLLQNLQFGPPCRESRQQRHYHQPNQDEIKSIRQAQSRGRHLLQNLQFGPIYKRNQDLGCIHQGLLCLQRIRQYSRRKMKVYAIRHPFDQVNVCRLFEHLEVTLE
jgi:hypothetical protein